MFNLILKFYYIMDDWNQAIYVHRRVYGIGKYRTKEESQYAHKVAWEFFNEEKKFTDIKKPVNSKQIKYRVYLALSRFFPCLIPKVKKYRKYKDMFFLDD
jgi:hypothetical protein